MKVTCPHCKNETNVYFYYHEPRILQQQYFSTDNVEYRAVIRAKALCPICGQEINKVYETVLSKEDIIKLAIQEEYL